MEENKNEIKEVEIEETEIFGITDEELEEVKKESDDNVSSES